MQTWSSFNYNGPFFLPLLTVLWKKIADGMFFITAVHSLSSLATTVDTSSVQSRLSSFDNLLWVSFRNNSTIGY